MIQNMLVNHWATDQPTGLLTRSAYGGPPTPPGSTTPYLILVRRGLVPKYETVPAATLPTPAIFAQMEQKDHQHWWVASQALSLTRGWGQTLNMDTMEQKLYWS